MPDKQSKIGTSPLERAIQSGVIGGPESSSLPSPQPASIPVGQPSSPSAGQQAGIPEFQESINITSNKASAGGMRNSGIPAGQPLGLPARQKVGRPAGQPAKERKSPKLNSDGWEQVSLYLPSDLRHDLRVYAWEINQEMSVIAAEALQEYLVRRRRR